MASTITAGNATNGMAITPDGTGILELKTGTGAGTTAISIDASQIVTGTAGNLMLVSGTAKTAVTDFTTSADFTSIPSWVKRITVMFDGVSLSGTDDFLIQLGDSGGFETTGYLSATTIFGATSLTTTNPTTGFSFIAGLTSRLFGGSIVLNNLDGNTWVCNGGLADSSSTRNTIAYGSKTLSDTLTQVRVTRTGTNTFDAGTINIMWE